MAKDQRIDQYILKSAEFARPILTHLRSLVHSTCPEVNETVKWGFPHFEYKGLLCSMAAFKNHCVFGFWNASLLQDEEAVLEITERSAMGQLGQIKTLSDLPDEATLVKLIQQAIELNRRGVKKTARVTKKTMDELVIPDDLIASLRQNKEASDGFERLSYSAKKEYIEWIVGAKTDSTRRRRLGVTIEQLAEGKPLHWKYAAK